MKRKVMPDSYIGREQAYIKHQILETYIQRLFSVVGQSKEDVINYVDCLSGPWEAGDKMLGDTSIGISLKQMAECQQMLEEKFHRKVRFRALYIEKDAAAFDRLSSFLDESNYPNIEVDCLFGDYTCLLEDIVSWCGSHFTFFFVDPKGWQKVVGGKTMSPLLRLPKAEFLINLMYDFINRFVALEKHTEDMIELFGQVPQFSGEPPEERQAILLNLYRANINEYYRGRTGYVTVEKPGKNRVHYYLVYLTRHARGLEVFKTEAEKMNIVQRITQLEIRLRKQAEQKGMMDMFAAEPPDFDLVDYIDNRYVARGFLLQKLKAGPVLIDIDLWADFLEETDLYPSDLQAAMGELLKEKKVKNLDADVSRRRTRFIVPSWRDRSERWALDVD